MRRIVFLLVGLVLAGAIAVTVLERGKPPPPEHGGETADRLTGADMDRLLPGALPRLEKKDLAGAKRAFESDLALARARGGLAPADALTAFAVRLREHDHDHDSLPYLRRAVEAYRAAAPGSAELALALTSWADALYAGDRLNPPPEVLPALREALALREKVLGRRNAETAVTYTRLGRVEGLPVNTRGDPARIAAAAERLRTAIRLLPETPNADPSDLPEARFQLAMMYARNRDAEAAFRACADYVAGSPDAGPTRLAQVADVFEASGDSATARRLREAYAIPDSDDEDEDNEAPTAKAAAAPR